MPNSKTSAHIPVVHESPLQKSALSLRRFLWAFALRHHAYAGDQFVNSNLINLAQAKKRRDRDSFTPLDPLDAGQVEAVIRHQGAMRQPALFAYLLYPLPESRQELFVVVSQHEPDKAPLGD